MTTNSIPFTFSISPPPSSRHQPKSSMPIFYYGLVIVGTASIILALYNFMILRWCTNRHRRMSSQQTPEIPISNTHISEASNTQFLVKSFKYKKDENVSQDQGLEYVHECPVCISTFQEGEDVRKLPRCKHTFHMSCIDMWLHSHPDCPVCRAPVRVLLFRLEDVGDQSENSREVLLLGSNAV